VKQSRRRLKFSVNVSMPLWALKTAPATRNSQVPRNSIPRNSIRVLWAMAPPLRDEKSLLAQNTRIGNLDRDAEKSQNS
jgi:hypothetical protein